MKYVSTRGSAPTLGFADVLLAGLATDGGLYVPETWPVLSPETIRSFAGRPYAEVAFEVLQPFVGDEIAPAALRSMIDAAYATFRHPAVAPLVQIDDRHFVLELFHGPTLAFKDVAMQLLSRLMDHVLRERSRRATIVGATSGDTGGAAIAAFGGSERCDVFILFPKGRVSPVQQRQMTTFGSASVHPIAVEGTFDDCQAIVKAMFNDQAFRAETALSGVNSINWARIMAQIVYYFTSAATLGAPDRPVSFTVPTGNFGDIFAGFAAKRMGLPIERLIVATNENDILERTLGTGRYEMNGVRATMSPSMDIEISSNFERLLFEAGGRDANDVVRLMQTLQQSRAFTIAPEALEAIRSEFEAGRTDEATTADVIRRTLEAASYLLDPHTAVGVGVAQTRIGSEPMITLGTAHPAKFPASVERACGIHPPLPPNHSDLMERSERFETIANDVASVQDFIRERSRAVRLGAAA
ncbi:threonine synthase [Aureimonas sp. AU4]|uniref:threonine synthase n=1 Tax=Aureimonas sp. AU4 TaxID=1638163 RepID=UPI0007851CE2|nr:threonine synthase [Aureimonas sp. AU4]